MFFCRSLSTPERRDQPIGGPGLRPDPTVAVPARATQRFVEFGLHHVGRHQWRVQTHRPRRGGEALGGAEVEAEYEL